MANIEAYVDIRARFDQLAGDLSKGLQKAVSGKGIEVPVHADGKELSKDITTSLSKATSGQGAEVAVHADGSEMSKDITTSLDKATSGKGAEVAVHADGSEMSKDITSSLDKATSGKGADIPVNADTDSLSVEITKGVERASAGKGVEVPVDADTGSLSAEVTASVERASAGQGVEVPVGIDQSSSGQFVSQAAELGDEAGEKMGGGFREKVAAVFTGGGLLQLASKLTSGITDIWQGGMDQVENTHAFASTLDFAGQSEGQIKALTKTAQSYADSTVYELSDVQNGIAQLTANGVKNADGLVQAMGGLNAVAGGNAETFGTFTTVMTQTSAAGKLTTENWQQLTNAIPGASGKLQEALKKNGAFTGNFRDAMTKGEISADEFSKAVGQLGNTKKAREYAQGTSQYAGAAGNLQATLTSVAASIVTKVEPVIVKVMNGLSAVIPKIISGFKNLYNAVAPFVKEIGTNLGAIFGPMVAGFTDLVKSSGGAGTAFSGLKNVLTGVASALADFTGWIAKAGPGATVFKGVVIALGAALVGYKLTVGAISTGMKIWAAVTKVAAGVQWLLNAAMNANPIGLIVAGLAALTVGLIYAYKHSEKFRNIVNAVGNALKDAFLAVVNWITTKFVPFFTTTIPNVFKGVLDWVKGNWPLILGILTGPIGWAVTAIVKNWDTIKGAFSAVLGWVTGAFKKAWGGITGFIGGAVSGAKTGVSKAWGGIKGAFSGAKNWATGAFKKSWAAVGPIISGAVDNGKRLASGAWTGVKKGFNATKSFATTTFKRGWSGVKLILSNPVQAGRNAIANTRAGIQKGFNVLDNFGRKIFGKKWDKMKAVLSGAIIKARDTIASVLGKIQARFNWIKLWATVKFRIAWYRMKQVFTHPVEAARLALSTILGKVQDRFSAVKNWATGKFGKAWARIKYTFTHPIDAVKRSFDLMFGEGGKVRNIFHGFITAAKTIFGKLKGVIVRPINSMISVINTGLIRDGINFLLGKVGVDKKHQLPWLKPIKLADGGRPIDRRGMVHGPGGERQDKVHTALSPHEFVTNAKAARSVGYDKLAYINDTGMLPPPEQYLAKGGRVWPTNTHRLSPSYPGHSGVDIAAGMGAPIFAPEPGKITYQGYGHGFGQGIFEKFASGLSAVFGHSSKVLVKAGQAVTAGQQIGKVGSTGHSTGPHLHFEVNSPGAFGTSANRARSLAYLNGSTVDAAGGGVGEAVGNIWSSIKDKAGKIIGEPIKWISSKIGDLAGKVTGKIGNSPFAQGIAKIPGFLFGKAKDWISSKVADGGGDGTSAAWNGASVGSLGKDQLNNAATIIATAKKLGFGNRGAIIGLMTAMQESTLKNLSGGDRDSVGLFQQRAPWGSFAARTNPAQSAAMFFNGGHGGQPGLKSKDWQHMGLGQAAQAVQVSAFPGAYTKWEGLARQLVGKYSTGGTVPRGGTILAGENGPELINVPGGSKVTNAKDTATVMNSGPQVAELRITNWKDGTGYFRLIAQDEIDQSDDFTGTMSRMRGR